MLEANNNQHWLFRPSSHQVWLNTLALVIIAVTVISQLPLPFAVMLGVLFGPALLLWRRRIHTQCQTQVHAVGINAGGWWLALNCRRPDPDTPWKAESQRQVKWRVGTIRGEQWVVLRWGWLPWQSIDVRPECMPNREAFKALKRALYQSVEGT